MPANKWATPEQLEYLIAEDGRWLTVKSGTGLLKGFYLRTTKTFLERWPAIPSPEELEEANGDVQKAQELAETHLLSVSPILVFPHLLTSFCSA